MLEHKYFPNDILHIASLRITNNLHANNLFPELRSEFPQIDMKSIVFAREREKIS